MATTELTKPMTVEEFLAIDEVDDGVRRELIYGELREYGTEESDEHEMTTRSPGHTACQAAMSCEFGIWNRKQPLPRGAFHAGEARVHLPTDPVTVVGMDVAYLAPELAAQTGRRAKYIEGAPRLAVMILSPSDKNADVAETVELYLNAGVDAVWVADPIFQTIAVHRSGKEPEVVNADQTIPGEPELPGFTARVRRLFEDAD